MKISKQKTQLCVCVRAANELKIIYEPKVCLADDTFMCARDIVGERDWKSEWEIVEEQVVYVIYLYRSHIIRIAHHATPCHNIPV